MECEFSVMYESTLSTTVHVGEKQAIVISAMIEKEIAKLKPGHQKALRCYVWGSEHGLDRHYNHVRG